MDKGADKKIPQMPPNISAQIVCPSPKVWDFGEKRLQSASIVRESAAVSQACRSKIFPAASLVA